MSNHLAVAAATATLARVLDERVGRDVVGAKVHAGRPDTGGGAGAAPEVRVFLYRIEPAGTAHVDALPARSGSGQPLRPPQIGLSLHYLFTFLGSESSYEPQLLLGSVVRALLARPLITRADIDDTVRQALAADPDDPLALTDLAEQPDIVRLSPLPLTLEQMSTLWSSFFEAPYQLSVAYQACTVVLTAGETAARALPVRERRLSTTTISRPTIRTAQAADGPSAPIHTGSTLVITGTGLRGDESTVVAFGGTETTPVTVTGSRIEVIVPDTVRAGVTGLRVVHHRSLGSPPTLRLAGQSSAFPVTVRPRLKPLAADAARLDPKLGEHSGTVSVELEPEVGARQQVTLMLNTTPGGNGQSFVFTGAPRDTDTAALAVTFTGVPTGDYLIRVAVDGAETALTSDSTGEYSGPLVSVP